MTHWTENHTDPWRRPRYVRMTITNFVICIFLTFTMGWMVGQLTKHVERVDPHTSVVTEDSPDWDCRTMGNQVCGPKATPAQDKVNAQAYADWCHGYVQTTKDERVVVGCDR